MPRKVMKGLNLWFIPKIITTLCSFLTRCWRIIKLLLSMGKGIVKICSRGFGKKLGTKTRSLVKYKIWSWWSRFGVTSMEVSMRRISGNGSKHFLNPSSIFLNKKRQNLNKYTVFLRLPKLTWKWKSWWITWMSKKIQRRVWLKIKASYKL